TALALTAFTGAGVGAVHAQEPPAAAPAAAPAPHRADAGEAPGEAAGEAAHRADADAAAAGLEKVGDFGSNPGALGMYRYAPDGLPAKSPVVLVLHGCTQDAATYFEGAGWQKAADEGGFSVVAPQQEQANNVNKCFNWFQSGDVARGEGEALSVKQMVDKTVADLDADPSRVYITGLSAGGAMTA